MKTAIPKNPSHYLIQRSLAGDQQAFGEIFQQYMNLVYKTAVLMLGNSQDAEDVLQLVFIQVYKSLASYSPSKGAFSTWLHRITVNQCLNYRRRRFRLVPLRLSNAERIADPALSEGRIGEKEDVRQALGKLSRKLRPVVIYRYYWGMSYAEIAEVMDIPLGTVKSRLALGMKNLGKALDKIVSHEAKEVVE
jgi:RNA polymerase sigma-70 factor (ECF subfamily)